MIQHFLFQHFHAYTIQKYVENHFSRMKKKILRRKAQHFYFIIYIHTDFSATELSSPFELIHNNVYELPQHIIWWNDNKTASISWKDILIFMHFYKCGNSKIQVGLLFLVNLFVFYIFIEISLLLHNFCRREDVAIVNRFISQICCSCHAIWSSLVTSSNLTNHLINEFSSGTRLVSMTLREKGRDVIC